jgi:uncharacterized protein (TIRG00374 family)
VPVHRLFGVTMVGFMASNLLPFRIGELVRAYVLGRSESLPTSLSLATILLERVLDGLTLLGFLAVGLLFLRGHPWLFWSAAGASILYLGVLGMLLALSGRRAEGIVSRVGALLPLSLRIRTAALAQSFATGLTVLRTPAALATALMLSLLVWLVTASAVQATFVALSLELPAYAGGLVLAVIALALTLPSAPGQIGTFQFGAVAGLALFAVPASTALSLGILFHALNYIPVTALGLVYLSSLGLTFREIHTAAHRASA